MPRAKGPFARSELRDAISPGSADLAWPQPGERGWAKVPRWIVTLLKIIDAHPNRGSTSLTFPYLDLLARNYDEGFVELEDEAGHNSACGFSPKRPRTWRNALRRLADLGFVRLLPKGNRKEAYALIVHPYIPLREMRRRGEIEDALWNEMEAIRVASGGAVPNALPNSGTQPSAPREGGAQE